MSGVAGDRKIHNGITTRNSLLTVIVCMYVAVKYQNTYTMHQKFKPKVCMSNRKYFYKKDQHSNTQNKAKYVIAHTRMQNFCFPNLNLNLLENFVIVDGCHDVLNLGGNNVVAEDCLLAAVKQLPGPRITQL